jgi:hypothetical protein
MQADGKGSVEGSGVAEVNGWPWVPRVEDCDMGWPEKTNLLDFGSTAVVGKTADVLRFSPFCCGQVSWTF